MTTTDLSTAFSAEPCDKHDISSCADCAAQNHIRRTSDGTTRYDKDCAVATFAELTGTTYAEATEIMTNAGFRPGKGTPESNISTAFTTTGFTVREVTRNLTPEAALAVTALAPQRMFYVVGRKGTRAHAWSISTGQVRRAFKPPYRYRLYEVTP